MVIREKVKDLNVPTFITTKPYFELFSESFMFQT